MTTSNALGRITPPKWISQGVALPAGLCLLLVSAYASGSSVAVHAANILSVQEQPGVFVIQFSGNDNGIPSWKVILRRDDAGNVSELFVPADSPKPLGARRNSQWPLTTIATSTLLVDMPSTMTRGRENYALFSVERFTLAEKTSGKIVIHVGGPSKNWHYEHDRTYTFTPAGMQMEGSVRALIDLKDVGFWPIWDRTQIADSHLAALPVRTQGRPGWAYMMSTGRDGSWPLPDGVSYPLEAELKLRRATPTFVRIYFDQNFESAKGKRLLVHNNKDMISNGNRVFEKLICMPAGPMVKGERQTFKIRYEFETQQWP